MFQTFVKSSVTVKKVNVQKKSVSRVPLKKRNEDAKTSDTNQELTMTKPLVTLLLVKTPFRFTFPFFYRKLEWETPPSEKHPMV